MDFLQPVLPVKPEYAPGNDGSQVVQYQQFPNGIFFLPGKIHNRASSIYILGVLTTHSLFLIDIQQLYFKDQHGVRRYLPAGAPVPVCQ